MDDTLGASQVGGSNLACDVSISRTECDPSNVNNARLKSRLDDLARGGLGFVPWTDFRRNMLFEDQFQLHVCEPVKNGVS